MRYQCLIIASIFLLITGCSTGEISMQSSATPISEESSIKSNDVPYTSDINSPLDVSSMPSIPKLEILPENELIDITNQFSLHERVYVGLEYYDSERAMVIHNGTAIILNVKYLTVERQIQLPLAPFKGNHWVTFNQTGAGFYYKDYNNEERSDFVFLNSDLEEIDRVHAPDGWLLDDIDLSPDGKNFLYHDSEQGRAIYLSKDMEEIKTIEYGDSEGTENYNTIFLDNSHILIKKNFDLRGTNNDFSNHNERVLNIFTEESTELGSISFFRSDARNGKILLTQDTFDSGFEVQKNMDVIHSSPSVRPYHVSVPTKFQPEGGVLSYEGSYILSGAAQNHIASYDPVAASEIPEKSEVLLVYNTETGKLLWNKIIPKEGYYQRSKFLFFESCNTIIGVLSNFDTLIYQKEPSREQRIIYAIKLGYVSE